MAQSYAMCGVNGGRAAWAKHCPDFSVDSILSDFSGARLGRPGLGDKMLKSAFDHSPVKEDDTMICVSVSTIYKNILLMAM